MKKKIITVCAAVLFLTALGLTLYPLISNYVSGIFTMIQNLSNTVILPIAGAILAIVMTLELIQLVTDRNNLNDVDTWMFFKWVFKSACAVVIVTHTWDIVMGIFEASQSVVSRSKSSILLPGLARPTGA